MLDHRELSEILGIGATAGGRYRTRHPELLCTFYATLVAMKSAMPAGRTLGSASSIDRSVDDLPMIYRGKIVVPSFLCSALSKLATARPSPAAFSAT